MQAIATVEILNRDVLDIVSPQNSGAAHEHLNRSQRRLDFLDRPPALSRIGEISSDNAGTPRNGSRNLLE